MEEERTADSKKMQQQALKKNNHINPVRSNNEKALQFTWLKDSLH